MMDYEVEPPAAGFQGYGVVELDDVECDEDDFDDDEG